MKPQSCLAIFHFLRICFSPNSRMACPFSQRPVDVLHRQQSTVADLDLPEVSGDSLTLTHLNAAMQLLTAPSNDDIHLALMSLTKKYSARFPGLNKL